MRISIDKTQERILVASGVSSTELDDGTSIRELDILYSRTDKVRRKRKATTEREGVSYWPNGVVPYMIDTIFTSAMISKVRESMADWERHTCISFQEVNNTYQEQKVYINQGPICASWVGMQNNPLPQPLFLKRDAALVKKPIILHELGHSLGLEHEHTRIDRDEYVTIHEENVQPDQAHNFNRSSEGHAKDYGVAYDYTSIMHYSQNFFSRDDNSVTITARDGYYQGAMGNYGTLSFSDVKIINLMYNCNADCPDITCPGEGFLNGNCTCMCPGTGLDPVQECSICGDKMSEPVCGRAERRGYCNPSTSLPFMLENCLYTCEGCNTVCSVDFCKSCSFDDVCMVCKDGFFLQDNTCHIRVSVPYCLKHSPLDLGCMACLPGYSLLPNHTCTDAIQSTE